MRPTRLLPTLVPVLLLAACSGSSEPAAESSAPAGAGAPDSAAAQAPADEQVADDFTPHFHGQDGWVEEQPTNSMRVRQYHLPGEGETGDAQVVVFHFGVGGGGGVEANLERWASQVAQPDGSDPLEAMQRSERTVGPVKITQIALSGTYAGDRMPGSGQSQALPGQALRGAVLECPGGPYFVKMTGPEVTVERWEASFETFLSQVDPASHREGG